jgi:hypothetical protein
MFLTYSILKGIDRFFLFDRLNVANDRGLFRGL